jgi:hypothetical protein
MRYAIDTKDGNKEIGTEAFSTYSTNILALLYCSFCFVAMCANHINEVHKPLVVRRPYSGNLWYVC